jgi:outer membrane protein
VTKLVLFEVSRREELMTARRCLIAFVVVLTLLPVAAQAQDGHWIIRGRLVSVSPNDSSTAIAGTDGSKVIVDDDLIPEVDLTYMFNRNWGLEVIAGTSQHRLGVSGGALTGADAGSVRVLPPTLTLQYHSNSDGPLDVYGGLGVNYTLFYSYDLSDDLAGLGVHDLDFSQSFGLSGQIGMDVALKGAWVFNVDVKYINMSTDVDLVLGTGAVLDTVTVDINPWVFGVGIGYRF